MNYFYILTIITAFLNFLLTASNSLFCDLLTSWSEAKPFPRIRHFTLPSPHHVVCTLLTLPSLRHFRFKVVHITELLGVPSVALIIPRGGCVSKAPRDVDVCPCCSGIVLACGGTGHGHCCSVAMRESGDVIDILG